MAGKHRADVSLTAVETPTIGGVVLRRHILDLEAASLALALRKLGNRIRFWFRQTHAESTLPDAEVRETIILWRDGVLDMLKEQRERAKLKPGKGAPIISDEEYATALRELVAEQVRTLPENELHELLAARAKPEPIEVKP